MWRRNDNHTRGYDAALKEELLKQLSQTVKEVQLHFSKTKEVMSTQDGATSLLTVLEAIFLHGIKRSLFESAIESVSVGGESRPTPSFMDVVASVTHKDIILQLAKLKQVTSNVGRSRAWLRLALNEGSIPSYFVALSGNNKLSRHYRPSAFLRDIETIETASRLLEGLVSVPFNTPLNSSLLNVWRTEPLVMSGVWAPAMRSGVQVAVDVASTLDDEETSSNLTASSSMRSLMTLDDTQAIRIILNTPLPTDQLELPKDVAEAVEKTMNELEAERQEIVTRDLSSDEMEGESREAPDDSGVESDQLPSIVTEEDETGEEIARPAPRRKSEEEHVRLFRTESCLDRERMRIEESLVQHTETYQVQQTPTPTIEEIVLSIPRETGLKVQNFQCADCQLSIGINFASSILCNVTGTYLCNNCHKNDIGVVPARIIYNWDHTKYPTGFRAASFLSKILHDPIFNIEILNPKIYSVVPELQDLLRLRKHLHILNIYLTTCKETIEMPLRNYLFESIHLYSLADLIAVPQGTFKMELEKAFTMGKSHVVNCCICKEKGFICEICADSKVIYPFDDNLVFRCNKCNAVYHGNCLTNKRNCPKCIRRKKRASETEMLCD